LLPAVTIIVPLLEQRDAYLEACLASAVSQTVASRVLVVVSNDTPSRNLDIVRRFCDDFANIELLMRARPTFAAAINTGIAAADTQRVSLLLSDDWLQPHAVETCLASNADIVSASMTIFDASASQRLAFSRPRTQARYAALESLHDRANYLGHFLVFQRHALLAAGGVDETIGNVGPDDFDLIWTLLERNATVTIVEEEVYGYRDHDGPRLTLRAKAQQLADLAKILDKHGVSGGERERLMAQHARWFGKTLQQAMSD
jgi:glycosyltransferase involved in cell wall biosynthesis